MAFFWKLLSVNCYNVKTSRSSKGHEAEDVSDFCAPADDRNGSNLSENIKVVFLVIRNKGIFMN